MGGCKIDVLASEIGNLGFKNTEIRGFGNSLQNLSTLEILDARGSNLQSLPNEISNLKHLTHLLVSRQDCDCDLEVESLIQVLDPESFLSCPLILAWVFNKPAYIRAHRSRRNCYRKAIQLDPVTKIVHRIFPTIL
ncbi:hypothetical protein AMTR_s00088p00059390 [Amborella trichopoda]|uniref:Leucine-rich repeat-containing N-terminal plant-type domain-containing protein n=1 Tax=Amborella trichopoda TaxID=13333 RepID=W1NW67_AMBTC|nr:hypothetical protein AMTR_s00088p00059390 [Amborella trichopoda]